MDEDTLRDRAEAWTLRAAEAHDARARAAGFLIAAHYAEFISARTKLAVSTLGESRGLRKSRVMSRLPPCAIAVERAQLQPRRRKAHIACGQNPLAECRVFDA